MKSRIKIILYISIAVVILAVGMIFILTKCADKPTEEISTIDYVDRGNKYLIALSYDKAVIEYTEAIKVDPMNAEAYIGLAEAYVGMGDMDKAVDTLELGYEKTGDERIKAMLEELIGGTEETTESVATENPEDDNVKIYIPVNIKYTGNRNYEDYGHTPNDLFDSIMIGDIRYDIEFDSTFNKLHNVESVRLYNDPLFYRKNSDAFYYDSNPSEDSRELLYIYQDWTIDKFGWSINCDPRKYSTYGLLKISNDIFVQDLYYGENKPIYNESGYISSVDNGYYKYVYDNSDNLVSVHTAGIKHWERKYNSIGLCVKKITFNSNKISSEFGYEYDSKNRLIRINLDVFYEGGMDNTYSYKYDDNDNVIESSSYTSRLDASEINTKKYDMYGNLIFNGFYVNDELDRASEYTYEYDENGNIVYMHQTLLHCVAEIKRNGEIIFEDVPYEEKIYKYDSYNNVTEIITTDLQKNTSKTEQYEYTYNDNGLPEKVTVSIADEKHEFEFEYAVLKIPAFVYDEMISE